MTAEQITHDTIVPVLADMFENQGEGEYAGEAVTIAQHMLQGAHLATQSGADEKIIAAALLHDVGHFTSDLGMYGPEDTIDNHHDDAGAAFLEPFFPAVVVECVRLHVAAKRYLCATDANYFSKLSPASVHTLELQGGPMSEDETAAFEKNPWHKEAVQVRRWDEAGKDPNMVVPSFAAYTDLLHRVVEQTSN